MHLRRANDAAEFHHHQYPAPAFPQKYCRAFSTGFFAVDPAHSPTADGCGSVWSIVQWIVSAHGGTITIKSEPSKLTTVTVRLPLDTEMN